MDKGNNSDRRRYFRVECSTPICTKVTIVKINNQWVNTGSTQVCVEDIGPGGLRFLSNLNLPVDPKIIIKFQTVILNESLTLHGYVIRKVELEKDIYQYGIEFVIRESERQTVTKLLNDLSIRLHKELKTENCSFCLKNKMECLRISSLKGDKRAHFRFKCPKPLCGSITILRINNKLIHSESDQICIEDIGSGGLRFLSNIELPAVKDIIYEFQTSILENKFFLQGYILRKKQLEKNIFEYGVKFDINEAKRTQVNQAIEETRTLLKNRPAMKEKIFCSKNELICLRSKVIENI